MFSLVYIFNVDFGLYIQCRFWYNWQTLLSCLMYLMAIPYTCERRFFAAKHLGHLQNLKTFAIKYMINVY